MKKYLSLLLLCAAVFLSSCEKTDPAEEVAGLYSYHETGSLNIGGQTLPWEMDGTFAVSKSGASHIVFTGDFEGDGYVNQDYTINIVSDESNFTLEGITYRFENTYTNALYTNGDSHLSWRTYALVTATYQGQVLYGTLETYTSAKKK